MHSAVGFTAEIRVVHGELSVDQIRGLDARKLRATGCRRLDLREPVRLGERDELDLAFLRLLREAMGCTLRMTWSAAGLPAIDPVLLCHLQPPGAVAPAAMAAGHVWRDRYGYGRCYYRRGPAFVTIRDSRDPAATARYLIDDPAAVAAFPAAEGVIDLPSAPRPVRELVAMLAGEGLAVRRGRLGLLLPVRMRHWPVPFNAV
ncbi:MAG TPA: DUF5825 family protein [Pilimelia sp.]|nr:DUF5825 family protein [Pilimelia sp.]